MKLKIYADDDKEVGVILEEYSDLSNKEEPKKKKFFGLF